MASKQVTLPASAGGFSGLSVPIPTGTCAARVQPTLADSDWTAGHELSVTAQIYLAGQLALSLSDWRLQTGTLQSDPANPQPCFAQVNSPLVNGARTAWTYDTAVFTVTCDGGAGAGAVVSFADDPSNLPDPILPPGYVG